MSRDLKLITFMYATPFPSYTVACDTARRCSHQSALVYTAGSHRYLLGSEGTWPLGEMLIEIDDQRLPLPIGGPPLRVKTPDEALTLP